MTSFESVITFNLGIPEADIYWTVCSDMGRPKSNLGPYQATRCRPGSSSSERYLEAGHCIDKWVHQDHSHGSKVHVYRHQL
jgi:hypothetical protein